MIQRAARFVYNKYQYCTVISMPESLGWLTLKVEEAILNCYQLIKLLIR